ncbi:hypothetical protein C6503_26840 [Candidatus Poribacteria bacterium]|nr:MAG: hypothetical protein C6503_26840 [Candidatus Poribacteria bacterium]
MRLGYTVGHRRVARLMKAGNLSVAGKRTCQTTRSLQRAQPCGNQVENLDICRCDQVWVGDITSVRLHRHFVYVSVLMDVFTHMIRGWQVSHHLNTSLTLKALEQDLRQSIAEIHHSDQGVQYFSSAYISTLTYHGIEISLAQRGHSWENGYAERLI